MVGPSIIFYIFFAIPYIFVMYWLVKQDKKYAWGLIVVTAIAIIAIVVSQKASKIAVENYKQHQIDSRATEQEHQADSTAH